MRSDSALFAESLLPLPRPFPFDWGGRLLSLWRRGVGGIRTLIRLCLEKLRQGHGGLGAALPLGATPLGQ